MLKLPSLGELDAELSVRVYLCTSPTDMRKGFDTLVALVRESLGYDPLSRHLFLFAGHGRDRLKILYGDSDGYSAHSMRATFITTALDNGVSLEEVQLAAGHRDPSTTKLYDRRGYNPDKSASFFANY